MSRRPLFVLVGVFSLLLGSLVGAGCTPDSSGSTGPSETSPSAADTTTQPTPPSSSGTSSSSSPASAEEDRTVSQRLEDASVAARVKQALVQNRTLRRFTFSPSVTRGTLSLRGDVDTREQYRLVERIAQAQEGVTAMDNQVTVDGQAVSTTDEAEETKESGATYHTVRRGETLSGIAREHGVSIRQIRALNDFSGSLRPGQEIRVQR